MMQTLHFIIFSQATYNLQVATFRIIPTLSVKIVNTWRRELNKVH
jgi:hypothetical protein